MLTLVGPYVNGTAVAVGGLAGAFLGAKLPERLRVALPQTFGLASMALGVSMIVKVKYLPAVVLALIVGAIIGELLLLEGKIGRLGARTKGVVERVFPPQGDLSQEEFIEKFVAILVLFCASGTGIFGAMNEGMTGDPQILLVKSILDFFTSGIFATALGYAVAAICMPQLAIQRAGVRCRLDSAHDDSGDDGGLLRGGRGHHAGDRLPHLRHQTVSGRQPAASAGAGHAVLAPVVARGLIRQPCPRCPMPSGAFSCATTWSDWPRATRGANPGPPAASTPSIRPMST